MSFLTTEYEKLAHAIARAIGIVHSHPDPTNYADQVVAVMKAESAKAEEIPAEVVHEAETVGEKVASFVEHLIHPDTPVDTAPSSTEPPAA